MIIVHNRNHKPEPDGAHARTLLPNFRGCGCPNEWLSGAYAKEMAQKIVEAADYSGLGVQGEPKITFFGLTLEEEMLSGTTIEIVLRASGFAIDFWPRGRLTIVRNRRIEYVYGVGLGNLDWCNREQNFNHEAIKFTRIMCTEVLQIEHLDFSRSRARRPVNMTICR